MSKLTTLLSAVALTALVSAQPARAENTEIRLATLAIIRRGPDIAKFVEILRYGSYAWPQVVR